MRYKAQLAGLAVLTIMLAAAVLERRGCPHADDPPPPALPMFEEEWNRAGDLDDEAEDDGRMRAEPGLPSAKLYPRVPLARIAGKDAWFRPRCLVEGRVTLGKVEDDGDRHFVVEDGGARVVCEIVPDMVPAKGDALKPPKVGTRVKVWGIPRWDGQHRWGEVHPVVGWKEVPQ